MKTVYLSSSLSTPTMIIAIYKLNGKILKTTNLEKKLKKITPDEIIYQQEFEGTTREAEAILDNYLKEDTIENEEKIKLYTFRNKVTGGSIVGIYDSLDKYTYIENPDEYERCFN